MLQKTTDIIKPIGDCDNVTYSLESFVDYVYEEADPSVAKFDSVDPSIILVGTNGP